MLLAERVRRRLSDRDLLGTAKRIARHHHVLVHEMLGDARCHTHVVARHELWRTLRKLHGFSYPELEFLFERDHTTIMSGIRRAEERKRVDG